MSNGLDQPPQPTPANADGYRRSPSLEQRIGDWLAEQIPPGTQVDLPTLEKRAVAEHSIARDTAHRIILRHTSRRGPYRLHDDDRSGDLIISRPPPPKRRSDAQ